MPLQRALKAVETATDADDPLDGVIERHTRFRLLVALRLCRRRAGHKPCRRDQDCRVRRRAGGPQGRQDLPGRHQLRTLARCLCVPARPSRRPAPRPHLDVRIHSVRGMHTAPLHLSLAERESLRLPASPVARRGTPKALSPPCDSEPFLVQPSLLHKI